MDAINLEMELVKIHRELAKEGIESKEYPTIADAVRELRGQYNRYRGLFNEAIVDRDRLFDENASLRARLTAVEGERDALRDIFDRYGAHHPHCPNKFARKCKCGFNEERQKRSDELEAAALAPDPAGE